MIFKRIENIRYIVHEKVEKQLNIEEAQKEFVVSTKKGFVASTKKGFVIGRVEHIKFDFRVEDLPYSAQIFGLIFRNFAHKTLLRI